MHKYKRGIPANKERSYGNFLVHFESCNDNLVGYEFVRSIQILNGETVPVQNLYRTYKLVSQN